MVRGYVPFSSPLPLPPHPHWYRQSMKICTSLWLTWCLLGHTDLAKHPESDLSLLQVTTLFFLWRFFYPLTAWGSTPELPAETYSQGFLEDSPLQSPWHPKALKKVLAVLQVLDIPSFWVVLSNSLLLWSWKTSGLLPFAFIIPKVRLTKTASSLRPPAVKREQ